MKHSKKFLIELLKKMIIIRAFEEKIMIMYQRGEAVGVIHLSIGQEAVAAGTCANLKDEDFVSSTHRGHGHAIAKGAEVNLLMAELFGRRSGHCKGKGGSMHIMIPEINFVTSGIAGGSISPAVGAALSAKVRKTDQVAVAFFGDGSSNQGFFHESLNFAALFDLPVIFLCENNLYGLSVAQKRHQKIVDIACRATGYNMPGIIIDGNDVIKVYETVKQAVQRARNGEGPTLIECKTYRWRGHHEGDPSRGIRYRSKEEMANWEEKCPIKSYAEKLLKNNILLENDIEKIEKDVESLIEGAVNFAKESPFPQPEDLMSDLFA